MHSTTKQSSKPFELGCVVRWEDVNNLEKGYLQVVQPKFRVEIENQVRMSQEQVDQETIEALENRAFHLPENSTWCDDWVQYLANNHPLYGFCGADQRNPRGREERLMVLIISILVGSTFTNLAVWGSLLDDATWGKNTITVAMAINIPKLHVEKGDSLDLPLSTIYLWTWMSCVHAFHDCVMWYFCCWTPLKSSRYWLTMWLGLFTISGYVVYTRPNYDYSGGEIALYAAVEILCCWLIWFPVVATIVFSGVLGCFRLPILGGRPREVFLEYSRLEKLEVETI